MDINKSTLDQYGETITSYSKVCNKMLIIIFNQQPIRAFCCFCIALLPILYPPFVIYMVMSDPANDINIFFSIVLGFVSGCCLIMLHFFAIGALSMFGTFSKIVADFLFSLKISTLVKAMEWQSSQQKALTKEFLKSTCSKGNAISMAEFFEIQYIMFAANPKNILLLTFAKIKFLLNIATLLIKRNFLEIENKPEITAANQEDVFISIEKSELLKLTDKKQPAEIKLL